MVFFVVVVLGYFDFVSISVWVFLFCFIFIFVLFWYFFFASKHPAGKNLSEGLFFFLAINIFFACIMTAGSDPMQRE